MSHDIVTKMENPVKSNVLEKINQMIDPNDPYSGVYAENFNRQRMTFTHGEIQFLIYASYIMVHSPTCRKDQCGYGSTKEMIEDGIDERIAVETFRELDLFASKFELETLDYLVKCFQHDVEFQLRILVYGTGYLKTSPEILSKACSELVENKGSLRTIKKLYSSFIIEYLSNENEKVR